MAVRLAINPITWVNDDLPSLGAGTTLDTHPVGNAAEAGFRRYGNELSVSQDRRRAWDHC